MGRLNSSIVLPMYRLAKQRLDARILDATYMTTRNMSQASHPNVPTFPEVLQASQRIDKYIHRTPVFTCTHLDKLSKRKLHFKCEQFQKTGAFKARGALNAVLKQKEQDKDTKGVVCHSSGNHAQALAYASGTADVPCVVVIPNTAPEIKRAAIRGYGAELVFCEPTVPSRVKTAGDIAQERGLTLISSHSHRDVIAGQGTIATELLEDVPDLDAIFVCASGGGMTAGIALAAKHIKPGCKVFVVEPEGKELERSLRAGKRLWSGGSGYLDTIADGIRVQAIGEPNFEMFLDLVEKDVFTVNNQEITNAMKLVWERMKVVIETSAAATVAAVLSEKAQALDPALQNIGVILCGGNVDLDSLPWITKHNLDKNFNEMNAQNCVKS